MGLLALFTTARLFTLLALVSLHRPAAGLELSLVPNSRILTDPNSPCGTLVCKDSGSGYRRDGSHITNMTLFVVETTRSGGGGGDGGGDGDGGGGSSGNEPEKLSRLASVSVQQPSLNQAYAGMKLYGDLKDGQATLRVELPKQADCLVEYVCELREVDAGRKQTVTSYRLVQQPCQSVTTEHDSRIISLILQRLSPSIKRLDVKLDRIEDRYQELKNDFTNLFANVNKDMEELYTRIIVVTDSMEENFIVLKDDVMKSWQQLQLHANEATSKALNDFRNVATKLNSSISSDIKSDLTGFFMSDCRKNTPVLVHPNLTPHPVIYRSAFLDVDFPFLCDTITDGGGWIVIQRRSTGKEDFYRTWADYKAGFGTLDDDFWLGNDNIHSITSTGRYELRVDLKYNGQSVFAHYDEFSIANEDKNYALKIGSYDGTAGDSLTYHNGFDFSTHDNKNDPNGDSCARMFIGAWWYYECFLSNLNGKWGKTAIWHERVVITFSEMKIRKLND
ncbi:hypothetical protein EGW08_019851 [Elysia chlorotica]|uniref:Fibrinogen C-terminal domain-containing protein n=1 Tax=Elysia chlorotica TaxID=188477 RepID=A0A3S1AZL6_ELYCH|nr:hypothetical protein EGW08_019851 [Elysia chlorotica]